MKPALTSICEEEEEQNQSRVISLKSRYKETTITIPASAIHPKRPSSTANLSRELHKQKNPGESKAIITKRNAMKVID